ncbi:MAG TPA: CapA family protein [Methylophilaceae bacterium]|nr:CapA family protein [Methylophilaceae bacterium]
MLTLAFAGDVMLGRGVDEALQFMRPEQPWGDMLPHLAQSDLRIVNLECALTTHRQPWMHGRAKMFHFRAAPSAVQVLQAARIDACALANNHILDFEEEGLLDTMRTLTVAGIRHAGASIDAEEASKPALLEVPGKQPRYVALLSFTDNQPEFAAQAAHPGTNYMEVSLDTDTLARVKSSIDQAHDMGAELVVFSNHWGGNFVERPSPYFRNFARKVIELGADIYHGHSAHICQGVEIYQGKPILYDTGDFIDDYAVDPVLRNDRSCLFKLGFVDRHFHRLELLPVSLTFAHVALAQGHEREAIFSRMETLSAEFGTALTRHGDRLIYKAT